MTTLSYEFNIKQQILITCLSCSIEGILKGNLAFDKYL